MRSRRSKAILAAGAFGAVLLLSASAIVTWWRRPPDPLYQGRPLHEWVADLGSYKPPVREAAAKAIADIGPGAVPFLSERVRQRESLLRRVLNRVAARLPLAAQRKLRTLVSTNPRVEAANAARALSYCGPSAENAIPALREALVNGGTLESSAASLTLSRLGPGAVQPLASALLTSNDIALNNACYALTLMGPEAAAAIPQLMSVFTNVPGQRGYEAGAALARIGEPAVPRIVNVLTNSKDDRIRAMCLYALALAGGSATSAAPALILTALDPNPKIRENAVRTLGEICPHGLDAGQAFLVALGDTNDSVRTAALKGLFFSPATIRNSLPKLIPLLEDPAPEIRAAVAEVIGQGGQHSGAALPALARLAGDPNEKVSEAALSAARTIRDSLSKR